MVYDYSYLKKAVYDLTKIDLNAYKEKQMKRRIDALINKNGVKGYENYVAALKSNKKMFDEFVNYLTINVSEFYRNPEQWELLDKKYIPQLLERFGKNIKIWSAACSTGDEPYSLVMAFSKHIPLNQIKIYATDLDKQVIEKAKTGLYNAKSVAAVPKDLQNKYFKKLGPSYQIAEEIKARVEFKEHNLLKDPYPDRCNLIVCRNVLIYFTEEAKDEVYQKFSKALVKDGILFIGSTEQIMNYMDMGFERLSSFYYLKK